MDSLQSSNQDIVMAIEGLTRATSAQGISQSNPYKFRVSRNAAANAGAAAFAVVFFDSEQYDTSNAVSSGVFTVPVSGYYQFNWNINATVSTGVDELLLASLFVSGVETIAGNRISGMGGQGSHGSDLLYVAAGSTVDIRVYCAVARPLIVGSTKECYFSGYLVSTS